jgi:hypothetical protein
MTARSPVAPSDAAAVDDYTYAIQVHVPVPQIIEALTDDTVISRWWTAATRSERRGDEVQLFMGDGAPFVSFVVEHVPGTTEVAWLVTDCAVMTDWVGTKPSFSLRPDGDGSCSVEFRHIGLRPTLECFDQCRAGWNHFMPSLQQFLETGAGRPNQPRVATA